MITMSQFKPIKKAVFPVAGLGTRFLPATKAIPKEMLTVGNKPLIQYAYDEAREAGIEQFIFVTGRNKEAITNHFDRAFELEVTLKEKDKIAVLKELESWIPGPGEVAYIRQQEPLGLGHAVWCARHLIGDEPFAVLLPDELFLDKKGLLTQMVESYEQSGGNVIAVAEVDHKDTSKYGVIDPGESRNGLIAIKKLVEKPSPEEAPSNLSIAGRYILQPEVFNYLSLGSRGSGGEIQLTDALERLLVDQPFFGYPYKGGRFDCGSQEGFLEANIAYSLQDKRLRSSVRAMLKKYI
jgi:UTP--glucose-1-phosphate uridylyltransferase